jgi:hypothetical protein
MGKSRVKFTLNLPLGNNGIIPNFKKKIIEAKALIRVALSIYLGKIHYI